MVLYDLLECAPVQEKSQEHDPHKHPGGPVQFFFVSEHPVFILTSESDIYDASCWKKKMEVHRNERGEDPAEWGPGVWKWLHKLPENAPSVERIRGCLDNLCLPCPGPSVCLFFLTFFLHTDPNTQTVSSTLTSIGPCTRPAPSAPAPTHSVIFTGFTTTSTKNLRSPSTQRRSATRHTAEVGELCR